jgi:hypothetical protein
MGRYGHMLHVRPTPGTNRRPVVHIARHSSQAVNPPDIQLGVVSLGDYTDMLLKKN